VIVVPFQAVPPSRPDTFWASAALRNGLVSLGTEWVPIPLDPDIVPLSLSPRLPERPYPEFLFDLAPGKLQCEILRISLRAGGYALVNSF